MSLPTFATNKTSNQEAPAENVNGGDAVFGFLDAFETEVPLKLSKQYNLQPLTTEDYLPWITEETGRLRKLRTAAIPPNATATEQWKIRSNIQELEMTPDNFIPYVFKAEWTNKILKKALEKGEVTDADQKKVMAYPARMKEMLAAVLSGLFTKTRLEAAYRFDMTGSYDPPQKNSPVFGRRPLLNGEGDSQSNSPANSEENPTGPSNVSSLENVADLTD